MKKIISTLIVLAVLLIASVSIAAVGTYTVTTQYFQDSGVKVKILYKASSTDGSVPDVVLGGDIFKALIGRVYLYTVRAYPITGGVSPDAANIKILNSRSTDQLGGYGANIIDATVEKETSPYNTVMSSYRHPWITSALTVRIDGQDTVSADFAVELEAVK